MDLGYLVATADFWNAICAGPTTKRQFMVYDSFQWNVCGAGNRQAAQRAGFVYLIHI